MQQTAQQTDRLEVGADHYRLCSAVHCRADAGDDDFRSAQATCSGSNHIRSPGSCPLGPIQTHGECRLDKRSENTATGWGWRADACELLRSDSPRAEAHIRTIPQRRRSKGSLICTAALELSTNQVTHFYSKRKNTAEMIKMLETLVAKYRGQERIYLSWDAASWHASKAFVDKVEAINAQQVKPASHAPRVELAPLPSGAEFLNVIESVFSGMARAVIHNSDYEYVSECKRAIDRIFVSGTLPLQRTRAALGTSSGERNASHLSSARQIIARIPDTAKADFKSLQPWPPCC